MMYKSTEDLQLNELNKNGEERVTEKWARALRVSSHPRMCLSARPAAVIELGLKYCLRNNQRSVPLGHAADRQHELPLEKQAEIAVLLKSFIFTQAFYCSASIVVFEYFWLAVLPVQIQIRTCWYRMKISEDLAVVSNFYWTLLKRYCRRSVLLKKRNW